MAYQSWCMSHYTMPFTNMVSACVIFWDFFMLHYFLCLWFVFDKTVISLALVGCEMIILQLRPMHLIGNVCSLSNV